MNQKKKNFLLVKIFVKSYPQEMDFIFSSLNKKIGS